MISLSTLDELQDAELRTVIEQSEGLLRQRDEERKAKALCCARFHSARRLWRRYDYVKGCFETTGKATSCRGHGNPSPR